ncbi:selenocysteine lyase/cysteine desulfurase, partial [Borrelia yangtzensis]|nr:selenocysteine lyase/cysteine desulfurase [Borreliella yangtzensis]
MKIKNDFEIFRKELETLYTKYLNNEFSYSKVKEKIKIFAENHKAILFRKDKFTNHSIILNLSKTRKIIKEYINLSVIEKIKRDNTFLFFWKSKKIKELKNIGIKDQK